MVRASPTAQSQARRRMGYEADAGVLKGKALLMFDPAPLTLHTRADAQPSPTDEEILTRGGAREGRGGGPEGSPERIQRYRRDSGHHQTGRNRHARRSL